MQKRIKEITYKCGNYVHVFASPIYYDRVKVKTRQKRFRETSEAQKWHNEKIAEKHFEMLIETNFNTDDFFFSFTYGNSYLPESDEQAERNIKNYIRRVQYHCKKNKLPDPVAVWNTETSSRGRYHHHGIIKTSLTRKQLKELWRLGVSDMDELYFDIDGLHGLGNYLTKPRCRVGCRRWHYTKNIKQPVKTVSDRRTQKAFNEMWNYNRTSEVIEKYYPDYLSCTVNATQSEITGDKYLYIKLYKKPCASVRKLGKGKKKDSRPRKSRPPYK